MKKTFVILANRLAESVLMNWDEEEVVKLAKEVAVACKENIDFTSLVRKMREAQMDYEILEMMVHANKREAISQDLKAKLATAASNAVYYEDKVDKYLENMKS